MEKLHDSSLYTFLDQKNGFLIHFLEGQKLIHDLVLVHSLQAQGFCYFRQAVLSAQLLTSFFKQGENFGLYIDSQEPFFRFKIEANAEGSIRTLLLPEDFNEFPEHIHGTCRLSKMFSLQKQRPYTSVIELQGQSFGEIINKILKESYQIDAHIHVSMSSDQSLMIMKLPDMVVDKENIVDRHSPKEYWEKHQEQIQKILDHGHQNEEAIKKSFGQIQLEFLAKKGVAFKCNCSKERMVLALKNLSAASKEQLIFDSDEFIETHCDYCKTSYRIKKEELEQ